MRSCARKEASAQEVQGYYQQFAEAKHLVQILGWQRGFSSHRHEQGQSEKLRDRTMGPHHWQTRQLPQSKDQMGIERFLWHTKRILQDCFTNSHKVRIELSNDSQPRMKSFSHWSQNGFSSRTILKCEPWCCVSIVIKSRSSSSHCCQTEETCMWHEWCLPTLMEHPWQGTVQLWHGSLRADRCCYLLYLIQSRQQTWKQNNCTQWHNTSNISSKPRVRTEVNAAHEKMLASIARSPASGKSVAGINQKFADDLFGTGGTEMEWRVGAGLCKMSRLSLKTGLMWPSQDKEFVGRRILNQNHTLKLANKRPVDELYEIPAERNTKEDLH